MSPAELTGIFRGWLGVPWVHQGRTRHGVDCGGLIVCALREAALLPPDFPDPTAYGRAPQPGLGGLVSQWGERTSKPTEGVLVLLRWRVTEAPSHLAYLTGRNLVHSYSRLVGRVRGGPTSQQGRVIEHRYGEPWLRQTCGLYRIPGVDYSGNYSQTVPEASGADR